MSHRLLRTGRPELVIGASWPAGPPSAALLDAVRRTGLLVDTAEVYARGQSESTIGAALPDQPVCTKVMPWLWRSPRRMERPVQYSLARLRRRSVSTLYLHAPGRRAPLCWVAGLARCLRGGLADAIGLCPANLPQLRETLGRLDELGVPLASVQVELSLLQPAAFHSGLLRFCQERGIELLAYRVMGGGVLVREQALLAREPVVGGGLGLAPSVGRARARAAQLWGRSRRAKEVARAREVLDRASQGAGVSPAQVKLAWLLHHGVRPIVGTSKPAHLREAVAASQLALSGRVLAELDRSVGL